MSVIYKGDGSQSESPDNRSVTVPPRVWIVWIAIIGAIVLLYLFKTRTYQEGETLTQVRFEELADAGRIVQGTIIYDNRNSLTEITGIYRDDARGEIRFRTRVRLTPDFESKLLSRPEFQIHEASHPLINVLFNIVPFVFVGLFIWFFFIRRIRMARMKGSLPASPPAMPGEQQGRVDRLLNKWEDQAKRMDDVLDRMERDKKKDE